jgi:hypothetical protein
VSSRSDSAKNEDATDAADHPIHEQALQVADGHAGGDPVADGREEMVNQIHRNLGRPENEREQAQHDADENGHAENRMREDVIELVGPNRTLYRHRVHDAGGNLLGPFVTGLERATGAASAMRIHMVHRLGHGAGNEPVQLISQFHQAFALPGRDGYHNTAEFLAQFGHVNANAIAPRHIHHVQSHDDGTFELEDLAGEKKIPFQVGGVHHHQCGIGRRMFGQPPAQCVGGELFIR